MPFLNSEAKLKYHQQVEVVQKPKDMVASFRTFNKHARECSRCSKPLEVVRRGEMLCDSGHHLAINVAETLYGIAGSNYERYHNTSGWTGILLDLTDVDGPVVDLCKAMDKGLRERKPASVHPPVYAGSKPVSRHSQSEHDHAYNRRYSSSSSSRHHEHSSTPRVHHHYRPEPRIEADRSPRSSGTIRLHVPASEVPEVRRGEVAYFEEVCHPNGGRVITKYYHPKTPTAPRLARANTIGAPATSAMASSSAHKDPRKSTVRFASEVKYYT